VLEGNEDDEGESPPSSDEFIIMLSKDDVGDGIENIGGQTGGKIGCNVQSSFRGGLLGNCIEAATTWLSLFISTCQPGSFFAVR
jgi:hypothetical protein